MYYQDLPECFLLYVEVVVYYVFNIYHSSYFSYVVM